MTMQVGMGGTDGVLIASDTQWTNTPMDEYAEIEGKPSLGRG